MMGSTMDDVAPQQIERTGDDGLRIAWSDGSVRRYTAGELRRGCPCATCREKHGASRVEPQAGKPFQLPVLKPSELAPLRIARMGPVGNYAYNIEFSDGHHSGLYTFPQLLELGRPESPQ
jgi:DUF971 family protein